MKVIGLTGGIGSGKSTIRKWFESQGVPCFDSDEIGKQLLNSELKSKIKEEFGATLYNDKGELDRAQLANLVFNEPEELKKLNKIVHLAVANAFEVFKSNHKSAMFVIKEAAILFESGAYKSCDEIILVCAPTEIRIERVMKRDQTTKEAIETRMQYQWLDSEKKVLSDYVIQNEYLEAAINKARQVFKTLNSSN